MLARIAAYVRQHHVALLALFIALGGTSYAATSQPKNSVGSKQIKNGAITTKKLHNGAVTGSKVTSDSLTGRQINAATLGTVPRANHASSADTATSLATPEAWHEVGAPGEPPFVAGGGHWQNAGGPNQTAAFYKDGEGVVHLKGLVENGVNEPIFVLPPGYRPPADAAFPSTTGEDGTLSTASGVWISVSADGTVRAAGETAGSYNTPHSLDGITFRAG